MSRIFVSYRRTDNQDATVGSAILSGVTEATLEETLAAQGTRGAQPETPADARAVAKPPAAEVFARIASRTPVEIHPTAAEILREERETCP